jgi:hypothetical protein
MINDVVEKLVRDIHLARDGSSEISLIDPADIQQIARCCAQPNYSREVSFFSGKNNFVVVLL